jgi:hypothetical protein
MLRRRRAQSCDQPYNLLKHLPRYRNFGHSKPDVVSMVRTLSPILISFSRRLVSDHGSTGQRALAEVVGESMELKADGVSSEETVGQPRPVIAPVPFLIDCSGAPRWL